MTDEEMIARIEERAGLAQTYAEDGAFFRASEIIKELGYEVQKFATSRNRMLAKLSGEEGADA